jgi:hypothetical protein
LDGGSGYRNNQANEKSCTAHRGKKGEIGWEVEKYLGPTGDIQQRWQQEMEDLLKPDRAQTESVVEDGAAFTGKQPIDEKDRNWRERDEYGEQEAFPERSARKSEPVSEKKETCGSREKRECGIFDSERESAEQSGGNELG